MNRHHALARYNHTNRVTPLKQRGERNTQKSTTIRWTISRWYVGRLQKWNKTRYLCFKTAPKFARDTSWEISFKDKNDLRKCPVSCAITLRKESVREMNNFFWEKCEAAWAVIIESYLPNSADVGARCAPQSRGNVIIINVNSLWWSPSITKAKSPTMRPNSITTVASAPFGSVSRMKECNCIDLAATAV